MTSRDKKKLLLSDTAVPDLFISDYMSALSLNAIKIYLYLLLAENHGKKINEIQMEARFAVKSEDVRSAVAELCLAGLINRTDKGLLKSTDIKSGEVDAYIQTQLHELKNVAQSISPEDSAREKLTQSIAATFFHGSMSYKWYQTVDVLLYEFGFEPDVVYRLFKLFKDKGWKLGTNGVMDHATQWHKLGICTMQSLAEYETQQGEINKILAHIGERLKIRYDGYDQDKVKIWVEKYRFNFDIIDLALNIARKSSKRSNIVDRVDDLLLEWFRAGIQSRPEAEAYEIEKTATQERDNNANSKRSDFQTSRRKQNFEEVSYSEEEIQHFESDPEEFVAKYIKAIESDSKNRGTL